VHTIQTAGSSAHVYHYVTLRLISLKMIEGPLTAAREGITVYRSVLDRAFHFGVDPINKPNFVYQAAGI
jgi:hypothetical protein